MMLKRIYLFITVKTLARYITIFVIGLMWLPAASVHADNKCYNVLENNKNQILPPKPSQETLWRNLITRILNKDPNKICCKEIKTQTSVSSISPYSDEDPYTVGRPWDAFKKEIPTMYEFRKPEKIFGSYVAKLQYRNNGTSIKRRLDKYIQTDGREVVVKFAGHGGFSEVFFYDPLAPRADSSIWLKNHSRFVIKLRKYRLEGDKDYLRYFRRDLAMRGVAEELSKNVMYRSKPFIRVAKDFSTNEDLIVGLALQEAVHGMSARVLKEAFDRAIRYKDKYDMDILLMAGFDPNILESMNELENWLRSLEKFYRDSHDDVMSFINKNSLPKLANRAHGSRVVEVALDFNHGENVIWDIKSNMWVLIDW